MREMAAGVAAEPTILTILHVPGLRGRAETDDVRLEQLQRDIEAAVADGGQRPRLLVVTGNLTESGKPQEFTRAAEFLVGLAESLGIPRRHVAIVPGRQDVNVDMCEAHFLQQRGLGGQPVPPYFPKWQPYREAFADFYDGIPEYAFAPDEPWTLFEMPDLGVVVAGLNSTMAISHQPQDDYGLLTDPQLDWFADRLTPYQRRGWIRLTAVHHVAPRDAAAERQRLPAPSPVSPRLDGERAADRGFELVAVPLAVPAIPAQPSSAVSGEYRIAAGRDSYQAIGDIHIGGLPGAAQSAPDTVLAWVDEATRLRFPRAIVTQHVRDGCQYLRVSRSPESGAVEMRPVGVIDGAATQEALNAFAEQVHAVFAAADPWLQSELVYSGPVAPDDLRDGARRRGIRLRSLIEYQGLLLDLRPMLRRQQQLLDNDPQYPTALYVDQRFTIASGSGQSATEVQAGLLGQAMKWLSADEARLVVVLGDFGRGKTSFLRQLTRRLPAELPDLPPVLVDLRYLENDPTPTLYDLLTQHLARRGVENISPAKLRLMIDRGRVALLLDGFDELELWVGYDSAARHLQDLLNSLTDQAKVVLTSRTQHFQSTSQVHAAVKTALGRRVESRTGSRVATLEDFTETQIEEFLTRLYNGDRESAIKRLGLIRDISGLLELTRNPRMLTFVAALHENRLLAVRSQGGEFTAARLYQEIIDYWLSVEEQRQSRGRGLDALTRDVRFQVCTNLALRMWRANEPQVSLGDLTAEVVATLEGLAKHGFSDDKAALAIASGSLLVRPDPDVFEFVHRSVREWLVAADAARELRQSKAAPSLRDGRMSRLMAAFFTDLAGPDRARDWAAATLADPAAPDEAQQNALAVNAWLPAADEPEPRDRNGAEPAPAALIGTDLRGTDLNDQVLRGAMLRGADFRGMRLSNVNMEGADLTRADLRGVVMMGGSLRAARLDGSRWEYAALLGTGTDDSPGQLAGAAIAGRDVAEVITDTPSAAARCVAFSPDGALLAYGSGSVAKIADAVTGRPLRVLRGHQGPVTGIAFSPDGTSIATASGDRTARTWDAATGAFLFSFSGHGDWVYAVAFSPDGTHVVTGSRDRTARIWDVMKRERKVTISGHGGDVTAVAFSPDGTSVATASHDHTVRTWDAATGAERVTLTGHWDTVRAVAFSPDGVRVAAASSDRTARTWDATTGQNPAVLTGHGGTVLAVAFSPDGTHVVTGSRDRTARVWDAATGEPRATLDEHGGDVTAVAFSPDRTRIATASADGTVRTWDAATGQRVAVLTGHGNSVAAVAYAPVGVGVATASHDGMARTWDAATGQQRAILAGHEGPVTAVAYSPNGTRIATASRDGTARTWDATTGQQRAILAGHGEPVTAVAYSPDGGHIATASQDRTARLWDATDGHQRATLNGHVNLVTAVAYSPDGTRVATASRDNTARVWDAATGQQRATLTGHSNWVHSVTFSPDGSRVATASADGTARLWLLPDEPAPPTGRRPRRGAAPGPVPVTALAVLHGHEGPVTDVAFDPAGDQVLTASDDGTVRVWRLSDRAAREVLTGHGGPVTRLSFSRDGRFLATASEDGTARIWSMDTMRTVATFIALPEGGYATLLPDGSYKLDGAPGNRFWWVMKLCRFAPGELDAYVSHIRKLSANAPIL
jgi:WD40 repeat protein